MYTIMEWSPELNGEVVATVPFISDAVEVARSCYGPTISHPSWGGGYVVILPEGGVLLKYFPGFGRYGFGGAVPEDAATLAARLSLPQD